MSKEAKHTLCVNVRAIRNAIRKHRDQKGTNRCWLNDLLLYEHIPGNGIIVERMTALPPHDEMIERCRAFHKNRQTPFTVAYADPSPSSAPPHCNWDSDIDTYSYEELFVNYSELLTAVSIHAHAFRAKTLTWRDDMNLYMLLPEKYPADTSLPPEEAFISTLEDSCEQFWQIRQNQHPQKLHE